jgi:DNA-binding MarR family transcriptional regulator
MSNPAPFTESLHIRDHCLCLHAQRAARALARRFDEALRPCGVTSGQFSLLNALNTPQPRAMAPVAALLAMDRTTLTAALKPLVRRGLVAVLVDETDRRGRRLTLTAEGRAVLDRAMPVWRATQEVLEAPLPDANALRAGLRALATA